MPADEAGKITFGGVTESLLDEAIKAEGANKGVPGMMKPEEIVSLENQGYVMTAQGMYNPKTGMIVGSEDPTKDMTEAEKAAVAADARQKAKLESPAPAKPADEAKPSEGEYDYDAITKKLEAGEALTDDEKAALKVMEKDLSEAASEAPPQPETVTINGKVYTQAEIEASVRQEYDLGDLKVSSGAMQKMKDRWIKSENRTQFSRNLQETSQAQAAKERMLMEQRIALEAKEATIKSMKERVKAERIRLEALASHNIKREDVFDQESKQITDPEKFLLYTEGLKAIVQLDAVKADEQRLSQDEQEASIRRIYVGFVASHPEYTTTEDPFSLYDKLQGGQALSAEDEVKVQELDSIITEARQKGIPAERVHNYRKMSHTLAVQPAQSGQGTGTPHTPGALNNLKDPRTLLEMVQRHKERQAKIPGSVKGAAGGGERGGPPERVATAIVRGDRERLGQARDPFLAELGFQTK